MDWLGQSEMGRRIAAFDWAGTPLGALDAWSPSLRTAVGTCLRSRFQMAIYWGPDLICLYNDAEAEVIGVMHPDALGLPARELLRDSWEVLEPQLRAVVERDRATSLHDHPLRFARRGTPDLGWFTYSYSGIPDDAGGIGGVLLVSEDTTRQVLAARRLDALRELAMACVDAANDAEACRAAAGVLAACPDLPFVVIYLLMPAGRIVRTGAAGPGATAASREIDLAAADPAAVALRALPCSPPAGAVLAADLFAAAPHGGARAFATPIGRGTSDPCVGFLVAGLADDLVFDDAYRRFVELVALGVGRAVTAGRERQAERDRAESLAALDRARTTLFSNVSHELRTPLALILGPLEQVLEQHTGDPRVRELLGVAHRNALRTLKLVNALLDVSRIEAGVPIGTFQPTDLGGLTGDVVAMFRPTVERAGLRLSVDCRPLPEPVHVDREAWQRIVSNLLSNAVKFTPDGAVSVRVAPDRRDAVLTVEDTGIGIPPEDREWIFSRFNRRADPRARTSEGSGIGLALVRELVGLHGGSVTAHSRGAGTRMTVRLPLGAGHLPPRRVERETGGPPHADVVRPFVAEAGGWLADAPAPPRAPARQGRDAARAAERVLVVDDNADMRAYLRGLLADHYTVELAENGVDALHVAVADPPDLVLSDVMLPGLDGLELVRELRRNAATRGIPVVLVSARADTESTVRALELGADDYVLKPFGARELLARVGATLETSRLRLLAGEARGRADERAATNGRLRALLNDLKASQQRVAAAGDAERRRIERDLHDGAQQRLMAIRLELGLLGERLGDDRRADQRELERLRSELDEALDELRELAHGLHPPLLVSDGLHAALLAVCRRASFPVVLDGGTLGRFPSAIETTAYFCCVEALQNVARHAGAGAQAVVAFELRGGTLRFRVRDDGVGFDPARASDGHGLTNLRDRLAAVGGHLDVRSTLGQGTTISAEIPLP